MPLISNLLFSVFPVLLRLSSLILRVHLKELPLQCHNTVGLRVCLCVCKGIAYDQLVQKPAVVQDLELGNSSAGGERYHGVNRPVHRHWPREVFPLNIVAWAG